MALKKDRKNSDDNKTKKTNPPNISAKTKNNYPINVPATNTFSQLREDRPMQFSIRWGATTSTHLRRKPQQLINTPALINFINKLGFSTTAQEVLDLVMHDNYALILTQTSSNQKQHCTLKTCCNTRPITIEYLTTLLQRYCCRSN